MELEEKERLTIQKFDKFVFENNPSTTFLVQIIERAGSYLNLETIPEYARKNKLSYNGVKKCRQIIEIFKNKFVIDN